MTQEIFAYLQTSVFTVKTCHLGETGWSLYTIKDSGIANAYRRGRRAPKFRVLARPANYAAVNQQSRTGPLKLGSQRWRNTWEGSGVWRLRASPLLHRQVVKSVSAAYSVQLVCIVQGNNLSQEALQFPHLNHWFILYSSSLGCTFCVSILLFV